MPQFVAERFPFENDWESEPEEAYSLKLQPLVRWLVPRRKHRSKPHRNSHGKSGWLFSPVIKMGVLKFTTRNQRCFKQANFI
jgi:hypothetical protein